MKSTFFFASILIMTVCSLTVLAQSEAMNMTGAAADADVKAIAKLNRDLLDAHVRKDKTLRERVESASYVFVNPGGQVNIKGVNAAPGPTLESFELDGVRVWVHGDTGILTGRVYAKGRFAKGKELNSRYRYMHVFVKDKGEWRLVATSAVAIANETPKPVDATDKSPKPAEMKEKAKPNTDLK